MKRWSFLLAIPFIMSCNTSNTSGAFLDIDTLDSAELVKSNSPGTGITPDNTAPIVPGTASIGTTTDSSVSAPASPTPYILDTSTAEEVSIGGALNPTVLDLSQDDRIAQFQVNSSYITSCEGLGVISNIECSLAGFFVDLSQVYLNATTSQSIRISGTTSQSLSVESNIYVAKLYSVKKVSNNSAPVTDDVRNLVVFGSKLYYTALDNTGTRRSYVFDGSTVKLFSEITGGGADNMTPLIVYGGKLILNGEVGSPALNKIFTYDGTNLIQVSNIFTGLNDTIDTAFGNFVEFNSKLYFTVDDPNASPSTANIYSFDGTNFQKITEFNLGSGTYIVPKSATSTYLYFTESNGTNDTLYSINPGASAVAIKQITDSNFAMTTNTDTYFILNGALYFSGAYTGDPNPTTFKVDESLGKIERVVDPTNPIRLSKVATSNNIAYGMVSGGANPLYRFNGGEFEQISPSTCQVQDLGRSSVLDITADGLYFTCTPGTTGLFRYHNYKVEELIPDYTVIQSGADISNTVYFNNEYYFVVNSASDKSLYRIELQ